MSKTRDNHYVPQWYQNGFLSNPGDKLIYLNLRPDTKSLPNGKVITFNDRSYGSTSQCFYQTDLYTTFFGAHINDDIEKFLFGKIDDVGARAIRAFIGTDPGQWHEHFVDFFSYIDTQKIRTPKGLDWIRKNYPNLSQLDLMIEMQAIRNLHCTLWTEGVREIVSAEDANTKFIVSDHPVTVYNYACPPDDSHCAYPNDPSIALKASQTLFPLDKNHCLILTNLEYAEAPDAVDPLEKRTHAKFMRQSLTRTDNFIRTRKLSDEDVAGINLILKRRAKRYIASATEAELFPETSIQSDWKALRTILLPPSDQLFHFGGDIYVGFKDGTSSYQDAFGRQTPDNTHLQIEKRRGEFLAQRSELLQQISRLDQSVKQRENPWFKIFHFIFGFIVVSSRILIGISGWVLLIALLAYGHKHDFNFLGVILTSALWLGTPPVLKSMFEPLITRIENLIERLEPTHSMKRSKIAELRLDLEKINRQIESPSLF